MDIREQVSLAPFTTLKIGGPARYFVKAESDEDVAAGLNFASDKGLPVFILGGGSNILVADSGFDGVVVHVEMRGLSVGDDVDGRVVVRAAAGEAWDDFVARCVERRLAGVENLSGIPGSVGGTPVQNVGAYGQEVSETIVEVRCFDRSTGQIVSLSNADCGFSYRRSIFNTTVRDRFVVLEVAFAVEQDGRPNLGYKDLERYFEGRTPDLAEVRAAVLSIRGAKSMVINENDRNSRSAGSFFKNPVVDRAKFASICADEGEVPSFPAGEMIKLPAAWLIERAGFEKGFSLGNAGISENHTLALVNRGGAAAAEILELKSLIQVAVNARFGIDLEPEPIFVGFLAAECDIIAES